MAADGGGSPTARKKRRECLFFLFMPGLWRRRRRGLPLTKNFLLGRVRTFLSLSLLSLGPHSLESPGRFLLPPSLIFAATVGPPSPPPPPFNSAVRQGKPSEADTSRSGRERERENRSFQAHTCRDRERSTPGPEFLPFSATSQNFSDNRKEERREGRSPLLTLKKENK